MTDPLMELVRSADPVAGDDRPLDRARVDALIKAPVRPRRRRLAPRVAIASAGLATGALGVAALLPSGHGGPSVIERAAAATTDPNRLIHLVYRLNAFSSDGSLVPTHGEAWSNAEGTLAKQTQDTDAPNGVRATWRYADGKLLVHAEGAEFHGQTFLLSCSAGRGVVLGVQEKMAALLQAAAAGDTSVYTHDNGDGTTTVRKTIDPPKGDDMAPVGPYDVDAVIDNQSLALRSYSEAKHDGGPRGYHWNVTVTKYETVAADDAPAGVLDPLPNTPADLNCDDAPGGAHRRR